MQQIPPAAYKRANTQTDDIGWSAEKLRIILLTVLVVLIGGKEVLETLAESRSRYRVLMSKSAGVEGGPSTFSSMVDGARAELHTTFRSGTCRHVEAIIRYHSL